MNMKRYQRTKASQYLVVGLVILGVIATAFISFLIMRRISFQDQFAIPWAAGRAWLLESVNPYQGEVVQFAENAIKESPYKASLPDEEFLYLPLFNLIFYLPFSLIPYTISRVIWVTLISICIYLIVYFSFSLSSWKISQIEKILVAILGVLWVPGITTMLLGHLSPAIILLLCVSIFLFLEKQDTTAGFVLAMTAGSFPISGLVIILMLVWAMIKRRWSLISAFFSGVVFIIVVSILLLPSWPRDWLGITIDYYSNLEMIQTPIMALAASLPGIEQLLSISLHAIIGFYYLYMLIRLKGKSERVFIWNLMVTLIIAYLVNIQGSISFIFLIYPALFLVFRFFSERWGLFGKIISWLLLTIFGFGSWVFFLPFDSLREPVDLPVIYIGVPILILIGMNWIRWWAIKIPKLPFET